MALVVISPSNVANFPDGGGHFWVYMQYVHGLRALGCEVYWLERFRRSSDASRDSVLLAQFHDRMARFGLERRTILYVHGDDTSADPLAAEFIGVNRKEANALFNSADLLLNFFYRIDAALLARFRKTALVDIDPGLLQFWMDAGQLSVADHHIYFTTGETIGRTGSSIPTCGRDWVHIHPPVALDSWPRIAASCDAFTTVSNWWGGDGTGSGEWIVAPDGTYYDNSKRKSFLRHIALPALTAQPLELSLCFGPEESVERLLLEQHGWRVRHAREVACSPERYRAYIQSSRGEFSCVKRSCVEFQNAWISDRSLCYLASGKPVVVENTGPSETVPDRLGIFRFDTTEEAAEALDAINRDYRRHCNAARDLAESLFDARQTSRRILEAALS